MDFVESTVTLSNGQEAMVIRQEYSVQAKGQESGWVSDGSCWRARYFADQQANVHRRNGLSTRIMLRLTAEVEDSGQEAEG